MDVSDDERFMQRALEHARSGLGRTTPNPMVGACVVTRDGVVVGQGAHERAGEPHAEVHALAEAGGQARDATLYCTLEPCAHTGRTGPCADRIIEAGVARVVAAMEDPFPKVQGRGFARLRAHGIQVDVGVAHSAAVRLNQPFLTAVRLGRPFVIMKAAVSRDGCMAKAAGHRTQITAAAAMRHAQQMRAQVDAIGVGSQTVLIDDPLLTVRDLYRERPLTRVVFDRRLRTPPASRLLSTLSAGPVLIVTNTDALGSDRAVALERAGATIVAVAAGSLTSSLHRLTELGVQSLVLEGGAALHAAAWDEGVVDYVQLYTAPIALGAGGVPMLPGRSFSPSALIESTTSVLGPDVLVEGYVHGPH
jgi:diaminohydroxyphosphoribosylaminopyrimidine deaminase / 5-amino-6-(5-phosphoribosylamino)uracil reductase